MNVSSSIRGADIASYYSSCVGIGTTDFGKGFLEGKVDLADMSELDGKYFWIYIHQFDHVNVKTGLAMNALMMLG